jgi:hypothetical protein
MDNQDSRTHHEKVLLMASLTHNRVADIHQEVNPHKRYDSNDHDDEYGNVIEWLHETGAWLFGPYA